MRYLPLLAILLAGCSQPAPEEPKASAPPPAAEPAEKPGVNGSLVLSGGLQGTFSWQQDLALSDCRCYKEPASGGILVVTMTNGTGSVISLRASSETGLSLTGSAIKEPLTGKTPPFRCLDNAGKRFAIDFDNDLKGSTVSAHLKGQLTVVCP